MYFNILKKDLKRKKTMNGILLIFIILVTTFISSSVNNLISISTAMESYFKKAGLRDYMIITLQDEENDKALAEFLNKNENAESWIRDQNVYLTENSLKIKNGEKFLMANIGTLSSVNISQQKFFDSNNNEITQINDGEIYMPIRMMEDNNLQPGDIISVESGDFNKDFTLAGSCKDAFLGSTMMGVVRFITNEEDYKKISKDSDFTQGYIYSVTSNNVKALDHDFNQEGFNVIASCDWSLISMTYIMDMIIAGMLLTVSICMILISLTILRFTIVFTLNEEFREIGIMKAIGIKERNIRGLYIIKYFFIAVAGSIAGFFLGIPFGNLFIEEVSKNIIISNSEGMLLINMICSILIVVIILLFCYFCTRRVNKVSVIEAIRNGSKGERFKRKGIIRLNKSRIPAVLFLAINDILSGPKKFFTLILIFTVGIILIIIPINTINTLGSDNLVKWFGMIKSDVYLQNEGKIVGFMTDDGQEELEDYLSQIEEELLRNGINASAACEMGFKFKVSFGDYGYNCIILQGVGITADQYAYTSGQAPKYENEIAVTHITAERLGARIGDTVNIRIGKVEEEYIITAIYQSMNNMGDGVRFSEKKELDYSYAYGNFAIQIDFLDNPDPEEKQLYFDKISELFPDAETYTAGEYIAFQIGDIGGQLEGIKQLVVSVILGINILVTVLIVKTFIIKEKGEIGMLKAVGFSDSSIILWQTLRIGIILFFSTVLGAFLSNPIAQISSGKVFEMMGASHIDFEIKPLEVYLMYPLLIFIATIAASIITALEIKRISAQETNNIE